MRYMFEDIYWHILWLFGSTSQHPYICYKLLNKSWCNEPTTESKCQYPWHILQLSQFEKVPQFSVYSTINVSSWSDSRLPISILCQEVQESFLSIYLPEITKLKHVWDIISTNKNLAIARYTWFSDKAWNFDQSGGIGKIICLWQLLASVKGNL